MPFATHTTFEFTGGSNVDVDATAEQLSTLAIFPTQGVLVRADANNSGTIWVGEDSAVAVDNGLPLAAGEAVTIPIDDISKIWVIGSAANQQVNWMAA